MTAVLHRAADDPYSPTADAETFDLDAYLAGFDDRLLGHPEGRRLLTRLDPLLFAVIYCREHLRSKVDGTITFADFHLDLCRHARTWARRITEPASERHAWVAPRECGKSTWLFLILPLWAAAHGHTRYVAAFADAATQAEQHLMTFKRELEDNPLLGADFPDLVRPALRQRSGRTVSDSQQMTVQASGFVFTAKGIDAATLGAKVGSVRPDLILCDDIEPDESNYSLYQMGKRLSTLIDALLPMNIYARVNLVGTVTMPGSIVHQLVQVARRDTNEPAEWIAEQQFTPHYYPPIVTRDDGTERSCWPSKWPMSFLNAIRRTRSFAKNFRNDPVAEGGGYWEDDDFRYGTIPQASRHIISVDPAVTTGPMSDYTGVAVISYAPEQHRCVVRHAERVKLQPAALARHLTALAGQFPETAVLLVEVNQGGDLWRLALATVPLKLVMIHQTDPKDVRAANVLTYYQRGRVLHERPLPAAEEEMKAYPNVLHDDVVDAVGSGVTWCLAPRPTRRPAAARVSQYA